VSSLKIILGYKKVISGHKNFRLSLNNKQLLSLEDIHEIESYCTCYYACCCSIRCCKCWRNRYSFIAWLYFQDTAQQQITNGPELQDDLFVGAALGVELTPWLGFEAEYNQVKGDVDGSIAGAEYKQNKSMVTLCNF
jgi:hypothetical protein